MRIVSGKIIVLTTTLRIKSISNSDCLYKRRFSCSIFTYEKGNILFKMGKMPEALLAFKKAETILKQVLSPEHPDIINCIKTISKINSNNE